MGCSRGKIGQKNNIVIKNKQDIVHLLPYRNDLGEYDATTLAMRKEQSIITNSNSYNAIEMSPQIFSDMCVDYLISFQVTYNGLISNHDMARFYHNLCVSLNIEECNEEMTPFRELPLSLQLSFIHSFCGAEEYSSSKYIQCISVFRDQADHNDEFGIEIKPSTIETIEETLGDYCATAYPHARSYLHLGIYEPSTTPITSESFVHLCLEYLLDIQVTYDGMISSFDVADFYSNLCNSYNIESCKGQPIAFHETSVSLQLSFINALCGRNDFQTHDELVDCINRLRAQAKLQNMFGLQISEDNLNSVQGTMLEYCTDAYHNAIKHFEFGVVEPSFMSPSLSPTIAPTLLSTIKIQQSTSHRVSFTYMLGEILLSEKRIFFYLCVDKKSTHTLWNYARILKNTK